MTNSGFSVRSTAVFGKCIELTQTAQTPSADESDSASTTEENPVNRSDRCHAHWSQRLILIRSGCYEYAEIELTGALQIVGPNNTGKTALINTLQFLYLDDRRHMDFGSYTAEQTREFYFLNQYSYVLFECLGATGKCVIGWARPEQDEWWRARTILPRSAPSIALIFLMEESSPRGT